MDNEILIAIEALAEKMTSIEKNLKEEISGVRQDLTNEINGVKQEVGGVKQEIDGLKQDVLRTNLILENEIIPSIQFLADGHKGIIRRLDSLENKTDEMAETVLALDIMHMRK